VVVDPSHGTGRRDLVPPMALAALAAGADGIMVEVHPHPDEALCDGPQALLPRDFEQLMDHVRRWLPSSGRTLLALAHLEREH
jgi:3-deoxy-7-phosphoheptulonate synthase